MAVLYARRFDHRKGALHPAQHFNAWAVHQQPYLRVHPQQPVDVVVGFVGNIAQAVLVTVPAEVITPVVATALDRPLLGSGGDVFDLLLIADEGVGADLVVLGAGGQVNAQVRSEERRVGKEWRWW